jgi:hypothetical protein
MNFGLIIQTIGTGGDSFGFVSREATNVARRPKLTINLQASASTPLAALADVSSAPAEGTTLKRRGRSSK